MEVIQAGLGLHVLLLFFSFSFETNEINSVAILDYFVSVGVSLY